MAKTCIVCGQKLGGKYGKGKEAKLPHGTFHLCYEMKCLNKLYFEMTGGSIPVVWFSMGDFTDHELVDEKVMKVVSGDFKVAKEIADEVESYIWGGEILGELWYNSLEESVATVEKAYVARVKDSDLPLIDINSLKSKEAKDLLEKRLKGDDPSEK
jgi:hypothetical protein